MNVNGSRFELLLGKDDWGRCLDGDDEHARTLASLWQDETSSPVTPLPDNAPAWDEHRNEIGLRPVAIDVPDTPAEAPYELDARRCACADRNGNVYRIGDDRRSLAVWSAGSRRESTFWPALPQACEQEREQAQLDFGDVHAATAPQEDYRALTVTRDDYLVVAFERGHVRGFLTFDLVAGGPPFTTLWPAAEPLRVFDMAPRCGGGVWLLDRDTGADPARSRLWELDCKLAVVRVAQPVTTFEPEALDDFQPLTGPPRERAAVVFPGGVDLAGSPAWTVDAIAVEALDDGAVLLLDIDAVAGRSRVIRLRRKDDAWSVNASAWLDQLPQLAHDFVCARGRVYQHDDAKVQVFIVTRSGNQAHAFTIVDSADEFLLDPSSDLFPLRRFGGRALIAVKGYGYYDSGLAEVVWVPIVAQPLARFGNAATFVTPVFASDDVGTTWDRVLIDGCLPPGTSIEIESRAGDERADLADGAASPGIEPPQVLGTWLPEPRPILRSNGPELPWLRTTAVRATRVERGVGTWELLLQNARGRYLQLRIRLSTDTGLASPRLRALRVWSPRFSYPQRFLPAAYREDVTAASFIERWLANLEGTLTCIEDRVVNVQALFDPRILPADALDWLASWFEVAFDPEWDERRRRLFIERAMDYFQWRGTVYGLQLALHLAFDCSIDRDLFAGPQAFAEGPGDVRIVETYRTRTVAPVVIGDPASALGPREIRLDARWTPAEGNAGLADRYARLLGRDAATPVEQITPFPLVPPGDTAEAAKWRELFETALGFVPGAGAAERNRWRNFLFARHGSPSTATLPPDMPQAKADVLEWSEFSAGSDGAWMRTRWQDFLARRYRSIERLNRAWATSWTGFDVVALPDVLPATEAAQGDWLQFERQLLDMHRTAHRFSVLLPIADVSASPQELERRLGVARRIVELEKPAHTVFDVRFYWAFFRVGEARLAIDTQLGSGSRAPELIPAAVLGRAYAGASFVGGMDRPKDRDRLLIAC